MDRTARQSNTFDMSRYLFIMLFPIIVFGCRKSGSEANYFRFQLNGETYNFDSITATVDTTTGAYIATLHAVNTKTGSNVSLETQSNIKSLNGSYSHISPQPSNYILVIFSVEIINVQSIYSYAIEGTPFTLVIDHSDGNKMHGSFSGSLTALNTSQNGNISNGGFDIAYTFQWLK